MATVDPWVCVSGELGDSGVRLMSKNTQEVFFQVCTHCLAVRLTSHLMQSNTLTVVCSFFPVQEPGQAEHSAAGTGELWLASQVSDRLCDGV